MPNVFHDKRRRAASEFATRVPTFEYDPHPPIRSRRMRPGLPGDGRQGAWFVSGYVRSSPPFSAVAQGQQFAANHRLCGRLAVQQSPGAAGTGRAGSVAAPLYLALGLEPFCGAQSGRAAQHHDLGPGGRPAQAALG